MSTAKEPAATAAALNTRCWPRTGIDRCRWCCRCWPARCCCCSSRRAAALVRGCCRLSSALLLLAVAGRAAGRRRPPAATVQRLPARQLAGAVRHRAGARPAGAR
ncbi:MAG: hypothetical protein MZW92_28560 [Comamonadaceae bacterium]|nr:hypothetical protein [Comamonadaceae bacterium]